MIVYRVVLMALTLVAFLSVPPVLAEQSLTPTERFGHVQLLRRNGELEAALVELDSLRSEFPMDVDYVLARAQVLSQLQRDDEALAELAIAAEIAPDYGDVQTLRRRLLARQPKEPDRWMLLLGAGYEDLSNDLPSWDNQFVELHYEPDTGRRHFVRLSRDARYSSADTSFGLGTERSWATGWFAGVDLGVANDPDYQTELGYSAHAGKSLADGWVVDLRYRRREYTSATVGSAIGTVEKYYGAYRFAYGLGWSRLHGASSFMNHVLTVNWYYNDVSSIGITLNNGDEAESLGNGQVLETDVQGFTLNGRRAINERIALQWWVGLQEQGDFYRRRFLGMAVSIGI